MAAPRQSPLCPGLNERGPLEPRLNLRPVFLAEGYPFLGGLLRLLVGRVLRAEGERRTLCAGLHVASIDLDVAALNLRQHGGSAVVATTIAAQLPHDLLRRLDIAFDTRLVQPDDHLRALPRIDR